MSMIGATKSPLMSIGITSDTFAHSAETFTVIRRGFLLPPYKLRHVVQDVPATC